MDNERAAKPLKLYNRILVNVVRVFFVTLFICAVGLFFIENYLHLRQSEIITICILLFVIIFIPFVAFVLIINRYIKKLLAKEFKIIGMLVADLESLGVAPQYSFEINETASLYNTVFIAASRCRERIALLEEMSYTDSLTQIHNRLSFNKRIELEFSRAQRDQSSLSLLMIDIDDFKEFNDAYGHQIGDTLLRNVAGIIKKSLSRKTDFIARYGGEEFAVLLPQTTPKGSMLIAEYIRKNVEKGGPLLNTSNKITISVGVTTMGINIYGQNESIESLISRADNALFKAKKSSKNCVKYLSFNEE